MNIAVYESVNTYADVNPANGAPDMFEDTNNDLVPNGFGIPGPTADFTAVPASGDMPLEVTFADTSTVGEGRPAITEWLWDFGNDQTSTVQNPPVHSYVATEEPSESFTVSLTVTSENGSTKTVVNCVTVNFVCEFEGAFDAQGDVLNEFIMGDPSISEGLKLMLASKEVVNWTDWDIEGLEAILGDPGASIGDGVPDAAQMALIESVVCNTEHWASASVFADMTTNKGLWQADVAALAAMNAEFAALNLFSDLFAGLIGSSPEMKATANAIILSPKAPRAFRALTAMWCLTA